MTEFSRPPQSAREIAALPAVGTTDRMVHVRANGHSLAPETLVYVTREAINDGDTSLVEVCTRFLVGREEGGLWRGGHCEATIVTLARRYRLNGNRDLMRAYRARCFEELWKAIYAGSTQKPFLEVNFAYSFWQLCIDAKRSVVRKGGQDLAAGITDDTVNALDVDEVVLEDAEVLEDELIKKMVGALHEAELMDAIRALPPQQARAALLNWVEGKPIEGSEDSVSAIMGVTPRNVYALLDRARAALRLDPVIRAIWFGEA